MKQLSGIRKADKAHGDDVTRSRFVKLPTRHQGKKSTPMPATATGTRFPSRVLRPGDMAGLLVSGHSNVKLGRDVRKGHLRGHWIYSLSLQERETCPTSCQHWRTCYGNNMPFAKRIDHTDPQFLPLLKAEIASLCVPKVRTGRGSKTPLLRKAVLVRLHALGDFYSLEYVGFWREMLIAHPNLAIYGYTAREPFSQIGALIIETNRDFGSRSMIRFSNGGLETMSTVSIGSAESCPPNAFICPEQTGKTLGCDTCGACWGTKKNVAFLEH